ncbi:hypothetical protein HMPREF1624_02562 [Sporothrix schenckii ATCC 58251]|uniref:Peptidase M24 domain-containing protein n=1 Tax=Sporothrix schenckii (strain ATCC 58251 / de Perez 2211183) TaxID=1391915 RepID=U7Q0D0_SPOS1|nr:hypothetical protein HMPREF1624_02562 [Sporothrix schenckii ATCC 58251]
MATPDAITAPKTALSETDVPEEQRLANLLEAQNKAAALFADIARDLIRPGISEKQLYDVAVRLTREAGEASGRGWTYGNVFCGHLVGDFPHERIPNDKITLYMAPGNHAPLRGRNAKGQQRHWILEIYLRDDTRGYAGFFEQILTV